jgi:hypothetical protein
MDKTKAIILLLSSLGSVYGQIYSLMNYEE